MTSAFGGQRSIQLSYGCWPGTDRSDSPAMACRADDPRVIAEVDACFNGRPDVLLQAEFAPIQGSGPLPYKWQPGLRFSARYSSMS